MKTFWQTVNSIYRLLIDWWDDINIKHSVPVNSVLIVLNMIPLVILIYLNYAYPNLPLTSNPDVLALATFGGILNLFICSKLAEEIDNEGFRAFLYACFLMYIAFLYVVVWYVIYLNGNKRKRDIAFKEAKRKSLKVTSQPF